MFTVQKEQLVKRPVPEVFAFVADLRNTPQWQSSLEQVRRITPGPHGVGTEHVLVRRVFGRRLESPNRTVAYVPDRHLALEVGGPVAGRVEFQFAPTHVDMNSGTDIEATQVTCVMRYSLRGIARVAEPLLRRQIERDSPAHLVRLAEVLEK